MFVPNSHFSAQKKQHQNDLAQLLQIEEESEEMSEMNPTGDSTAFTTLNNTMQTNSPRKTKTKAAKHSQDRPDAIC